MFKGCANTGAERIQSLVWLLKVDCSDERHDVGSLKKHSKNRWPYNLICRKRPDFWFFHLAVTKSFDVLHGIPDIQVLAFNSTPGTPSRTTPFAVHSL